MSGQQEARDAEPEERAILAKRVKEWIWQAMDNAAEVGYTTPGQAVRNVNKWAEDCLNCDGGIAALYHQVDNGDEADEILALARLEVLRWARDRGQSREC